MLLGVAPVSFLLVVFVVAIVGEQLVVELSSLVVVIAIAVNGMKRSAVTLLAMRVEGRGSGF